MDREERPDLDHIYQTAVQLLTGQGGWPLTMFLTPEQEPFLRAAPIFLPMTATGAPGFPRLLHALADAYRNRQQDVSKSTTEIREAMQKLSGFREDGGDLSPDLVTNAVRTLAGHVDMVHGGFGSQPKFPNPTNLDCLLRYWRYSGNENILNVVRLSLDKMADGGIYDQLGGGFHRYSVDDHWLVPHFEKMLYDNAQLLSLYAAMYRITGEPRYARVTREVLDYVEREMCHPGGGFYATQDADSEGEEGRFFVWTKAEVDALLGDDSRLFCRYYDVTEAGNWESGSNILHLTVSFAAACRAVPDGRGNGGRENRSGAACPVPGAGRSASNRSGREDPDGLERPDAVGDGGRRDGARRRPGHADRAANDCLSASGDVARRCAAAQPQGRSVKAGRVPR